jgi:hypothetical protein
MIKLSDIKPENRHLLEDENYLLLQKLWDWENEYDFIPWEKFRDNYFKCSRCGGYDDQQCICYAR